jgi:hypothetical protein
MLAGGFSLPKAYLPSAFNNGEACDVQQNEGVSSIGGVTWTMGRAKALLFSVEDQFAFVLLYDTKAESAL